MSKPIADDFEFIRSRMKEIKPEPTPAETVVPKAVPQPTGKPLWATPTDPDDEYWQHFYGLT